MIVWDNDQYDPDWGRRLGVRLRNLYSENPMAAVTALVEHWYEPGNAGLVTIAIAAVLEQPLEAINNVLNQLEADAGWDDLLLCDEFEGVLC